MRRITFWLTLVLVFMIPWEDSVILTGVGRISRVAGLAVGVFWLGTILARGRVRQLRPFHLLCFVYFFWHGLSVVWSVAPNTTLNRLTTYIQLAFLLFLVWDLCLTRKQLMAILQAYVLGAYISVFDTISNYLMGVSRGSTPRYAATGFNANGLAMVLVFGLPLAWYLAVSVGAKNEFDRKQSILRIINFVYIPAAIFAILLTASRTALFGMLPIIWFMLGSFTRLKPVMRIAIAIGVMAAFYFIQPLVPQSSIDRLSTVSTEIEGGDLSGRRTIWDEGLEQFWNNPLLGTGSGAFKAAVNFKDKAAHNVYVSLLVEVGLIGLMLFGLVIAVSAYHTRYLPRWEAAFWLALIVSWLIGNYTGSWELKKHTWLFFSLVIVSANLLPQDESEAESGEVMVPPLAGTSPSRNGIPTRQNSYTYNPKL